MAHAQWIGPPRGRLLPRGKPCPIRTRPSNRPSTSPAGSDPTTPLPSGPPAQPAAAAPARRGQPPAAASRGADRRTERHVEHPRPRTEGAGFFTALFDFSFTNFVTPILVRFVYLLATVALVVSWLIFVFVGFAQSVGTGFVALILGPVFVIIYLAVIRMTLEFYLSVVRMSEDIHKRLPQA